MHNLEVMATDQNTSMHSIQHKVIHTLLYIETIRKENESLRVEWCTHRSLVIMYTTHARDDHSPQLYNLPYTLFGPVRITI